MQLYFDREMWGEHDGGGGWIRSLVAYERYSSRKNVIPNRWPRFTHN